MRIDDLAASIKPRLARSERSECVGRGQSAERKENDRALHRGATRRRVEMSRCHRVNQRGRARLGELTKTFLYSLLRAAPFRRQQQLLWVHEVSFVPRFLQ